jgi:hypothetical protein
MKSNNSWRIRLAQILLGAAFLLAFVVVRGTYAGTENSYLTASWIQRHSDSSGPSNPVQRLKRAGYELAASPQAQAPTSGVSFPDDWSQRHVVYSSPGTFVDAVNKGTVNHFLSVANDPRYIIQQVKRSAMAQRKSGTSVAGINGADRIAGAAITGGPSLWETLRKPWRTGDRKTPGATQLLAGELFMVILWLVCAAALIRQRRWAPTMLLVLSTGVFLFISSCGGGGSTSIPEFIGVNSGTGINQDWQMLPAASSNGVAGVYPAKYSFSSTIATCTDFMVFPSDVAGSATAASIVAYTNLYTGCAQTLPIDGVNNPAPNTLLAVNLNGGTVATSPALSLDGTQVAFVATIAGVANFVVLDMPSSPTGAAVSQITSIGTVNSSTPCTAPCADWVAFNGATNDTISSPFIDYANNVVYVGDAKGVLHKFTNVFHGYLGGSNTTEPTEVIGGGVASGWPQAISFNTVLSDPVYDNTSQKIFVGIDAADSDIASIPSTGGSRNIVQSAQLNSTNSTHSFSIVLDPAAGEVYVFTAHANGAAFDTSGVAQLPVGFTASTTPTWATIGTGGAGALDTDVMYEGTFDNNFYTGAANPNLYVCTATESTSSPGTIIPTLFRISMSGTFGATVAAGPLVGATANTDCSAVTEFYNPTGNAGGPIDYLFLSQVGTNVTASPISCTAGTGCIMSFDVTTGTEPFSSAAPLTHATAVETAGTSGIIVDNSAGRPVTGASQIYFSVLGNGSCARTVTGTDTSGSANITATSGIFTSGDVGAAISGTGVPAATTISSVTNSTTAVMSNAATGSNPSAAWSVTDTGGCSTQASQRALQ